MVMMNLRSPRVHDAGRRGTGALSAVVMVHAEVVTELMSNDGGERRDVVVGELTRKQREKL